MKPLCKTTFAIALLLASAAVSAQPSPAGTATEQTPPAAAAPGTAGSAAAGETPTAEAPSLNAIATETGTTPAAGATGATGAAAGTAATAAEVPATPATAATDAAAVPATTPAAAATPAPDAKTASTAAISEPASASASSSEAATAKPEDRTGGVALAARISTLGFGVEAVTRLHKRVNLRAQGNFFSYSDTIKESDIDYEGKLKLNTLGALIDIHPFAGGLRLTAGGFSNGNKIDLAATCKMGSECEVGDVTVSSDASSSDPRVFGGAKFKSFAPYVGLGYGNAMRGFPFHFAFDIGVLVQGATQINLDASGIARVTDNETGVTTTRDLATDPDFQDQLRKESANAEDSAKEYKYYPVVSLTIGYRLF